MTTIPLNNNPQMQQSKNYSLSSTTNGYNGHSMVDHELTEYANAFSLANPKLSDSNYNLASKLRKIKENLDNHYVAPTISSDKIAFSKKMYNSEACQNLNRIGDDFQTKTSFNFNNSQNQNSCYTNSASVSTKSSIVSINNNNTSNSMRPQNRMNKFNGGDNSFTTSFDSASKYLLTKNNFDFELNNNQTSLDHILDQFSDNLSFQNSDINSNTLESTSTNNHNKNNKLAFNMNSDNSTFSNHNSINTNGGSYFSEIDIKREKAVNNPNHNETKRPFIKINNNSSNQTGDNNKKVVYLKQAMPNGGDYNTNSMSNGKTNLINLKQAVYSENISRQSSIRSLLSNPIENGQILNGNHNQNKNGSNNGYLVKPNLIEANQTVNLSENQNFARIKQLKAKSQNGINNNGAPLSIYTQNEAKLLNDWDVYRSKNNDKIITNQTSFRPETRLSFQPQPSNSSMHTQNSLLPNRNSTNNEYSDNTAASSNLSSARQYQEAGEDCESVLLTPTNENEYYYNEQGRIKANNDDNESILSEFVTHLKFDDANGFTNNKSFKGEFISKFFFLVKKHNSSFFF